MLMTIWLKRKICEYKTPHTSYQHANNNTLQPNSHNIIPIWMSLITIKTSKIF